MPARSKLPPLVRLIISLVVCAAAGSINAFLALPLMPGWFDALKRPAFLPPDQYLVPLALLVYLILGFILYFLWQESRGDPQDRRYCIALLFITLIVLDLWGYLFFGLKSPLMGVMGSVLAIAILMATMVQAIRVSFSATLLLFPIVIIVFIMAYANYLIVQLNPFLPAFGI